MLDAARHLHRLGPAPFVATDFEGRSYTFTLLEIRKDRGAYTLTWETTKPFSVKADVMLHASILEDADAPTLAKLAAERVEIDLRDRAFVAELER